MKTPSRTTMAAAAWLACSGCAVLFPQVSFADTTFKVSGYGTVAGTITDNADYKFRSSMNQSEGADKGFDFFTDSKLGLQGVANFNNGFSITGQLLGQRKREDATATSNNDFNVGFEWLYGQYSPTSNIDVRLGRVVLPAFMISDSRNVGYSQPWLRAPMSVYAGMPLSSLDGGQINFRLPMGSSILTIQPSYGKSSYNLVSGSLVIKDRSKWVGGVNASLEYGDWTIRAGQVRSRTPEQALAFFGDALGPVIYDLKDKFTSLGLQFDNGKAVVMTEWTQRKMSQLPGNGPALWSIATVPNLGPTTFENLYDLQVGSGKPLAKNDAFYVAGGWRFGSVLPMLAYGQTKNKQTKVKNKELSASVRYDFMSNVALKAQISRFNARDSQSFVTAAGSTSPDYNKKINVFSIGLDFVF
jgi:hypothetical protein